MLRNQEDGRPQPLSAQLNESMYVRRLVTLAEDGNYISRPPRQPDQERDIA